MFLKLYAHGTLPVRCVWCDWCGELNKPLYAHVSAWNGAFTEHGLGWTDAWDPKVSDDVGVLKSKTVLLKFWHHMWHIVKVLLILYTILLYELQKTCCGTLHKTLKWLATCKTNVKC